MCYTNIIIKSVKYNCTTYFSATALSNDGRKHTRARTFRAIKGMDSLFPTSFLSKLQSEIRCLCNSNITSAQDNLLKNNN